MIKTLVRQITDIKSVKKVFMKKRDVKEYNESWDGISNILTEYDVNIVANLTEQNELHKFILLEREVGLQFPKFKFNYNLIELDTNISNQSNLNSGKLIYDSDSIPKQLNS